MKEKTIKNLESFNVKDLYVSGKTTKEISDIVKCSPSLINKYLKEIAKIQLRQSKRRQSLREIPIVGSKYGQWTVVSNEVKAGSVIKKESNSRNLYWNVQCNCGKKAWRTPNDLKSNNTRACKSCCKKNGTIDSFILSIFNKIKLNLKTRKKVGKLDFNITSEYIQDLYNNNHYCALSGIDIEYNKKLCMSENCLSIDRINSNKGYIKGNIQIVQKDINMMKGSLTQEKFIYLCKLVASHN